MCNYNFNVPVDPYELLGMIKQLVEQNGGTVSGQIPEISVSLPTPVGRVAGKCKLVEGSLVNLSVTQKPEFMSCGMVRDKLVYYLTEAVRLYSLQAEPVH